MKDPFIREKFTRERSAARKLAKEYFERFPKDRYQTEVESWRQIQSQNIEFIMKRLREPVRVMRTLHRNVERVFTELQRYALGKTEIEAGSTDRRFAPVGSVFAIALSDGF